MRALRERMQLLFYPLPNGEDKEELFLFRFALIFLLPPFFLLKYWKSPSAGTGRFFGPVFCLSVGSPRRLRLAAIFLPFFG